jgi:hypothetical protein
MTLLTAYAPIEYAGNGTTVDFVTGFKFSANSQLVVTLVDDATDIGTVQTITTEYTVAGRNTPTGGTVTMLTAPASGKTLRIERVTSRTQEKDLRIQSAFNPEVIEMIVDEVVQMLQELEYATETVLLTGSAVYDPASLNDGAGVTTTVTVTGAALGDWAQASFSLDLQSVLLSAYVSAANTVSVRFQNETTGTVNLSSGTIKVVVRPAA